ncbi:MULTISPECIES: RNA polymerase sigma factor [Chryseobacterium]|uniref:RNA polymerase sigma factor n=1 Tax=Chryseobacterium TaxID=59732 RepID=UPI0027D7FF0A|nr:MULTISPECIES: sigma-70 family RNA polymerase sigma factor [Chryseobacterium]
MSLKSSDDQPMPANPLKVIISDEQELVNDLLKKEKNAWKYFYNLHARDLIRICGRYISDREQIGDILQEGFVKMFQSIDKFEYRGDGSLRAWMTRIIINEALAYLRASTKNMEESVDPQEIPDTGDHDEPEVEAVPESVLYSMIQELPDGYRTVFNLFVFENMGHKEIAKRLGIAESSSASQFHRAKKILVKKITDYKNSNKGGYGR